MVTARSDQCAGIRGHWGVSLRAEASQNIWNVAEKKVKKTSSKARQLLPPGLPRYPASISMALHTPVPDCAKELGTQKLFVLPSVQTVPCGRGLSLSSQDQTHPPSQGQPPSARPAPAARGCGAVPPPSGAFPGSAAFTGIYWRAQITPVKIIGYAKLRCLDWVSSVWPARCESQSAPQTLRALSLCWLDMIALGLGSWGGKLALGSAQRDTNHRWLQWDRAPEPHRAPKPGLAKPRSHLRGGCEVWVWGALRPPQPGWRGQAMAAGRICSYWFYHGITE